MFSENKGQTREQNKCVKVQNKIWPVFYGYVSLVVNTSLSFPHSWLITGFVTKLTWRVSQVEQELPTLLDHLSSPLVFGGVRVTRSLVLYVYFVDRCLSFCTFSFGHCVVCSSDFDYPFGILKLFLWSLTLCINLKLVASRELKLLSGNQM